MSFISKIIHILFHKHHSGSFSSEGFAGVEGRGLAIGVIVILIPFFEEGYLFFIEGGYVVLVEVDVFDVLIEFLIIDVLMIEE